LSDETQETPVEEAATPAFLFEFDHLVAGIREASYEVLQSIFDDVDLTQVHYSKYCLAEGPHKTIDLLQTGLGIDLVEFSRDLEPYPKADAWLRLTKELNIPASRSISLTTSAQACKSSITADIPTISVPDRFTTFQDFGGAMAVLDTLPEIDLSSYLDREIVSV
jgi:hypothetical protein